MTKWLQDGELFRKLFLQCMTCVFIDNGREPTSLVRLVFDDAEIGTRAFASLVQKLLEWSGDQSCSYVVLRPDPVHYFHRLFDAFPVVEIDRGSAPEEYLASLNRGPEQSPADAIGTNYDERVIVPPSLNWFVHSFSSSGDQDGHLWIPSGWVGKVAEVYPYATVPASV